MSPTEINLAVSEVLGEALEVVRQRGFSLVEPHINDPNFDQHVPSIIDWDATVEEDRVISLYEVAT